MLALLGLLGLTMAGTAFVGLPSSDDDDTETLTVPKSQDSEEPDLLDLIESDLTEENSTELPTAVVAGGSEEDDILNGKTGDDYLSGGNGNDTLIGDDGSDQLHGGDGSDLITGNGGDDLVYGYTGDDALTGGSGDDTVHGGDGNDMVHGGAGNDMMSGGYGNDTLIGGAGHDNIQGSEGDDIIDGASGEDIAQKDYLNGSEGNDTLIGNNGDVMSGGTGDDTFEVVDGAVEIMDYDANDVLVLNYDGDEPDLTVEINATGTILLADGTPVASLYGVTSFDVGTVQLVAS